MMYIQCGLFLLLCKVFPPLPRAIGHSVVLVLTCHDKSFSGQHSHHRRVGRAILDSGNYGSKKGDLP